MTKDTEELLQEVYESHQIQDRMKSEIFSLRASKLFIVIILAAVCFGFIYLAYNSNDYPLTQSYLIEFSAGIALFITALLFLVVSINTKKCLFWGALIFSLLCFIGAYNSTNVDRSFFIEASVGTLLIVALDLYISSILKKFDTSEKSAQKKLHDAKKALSSAETQLDYDNIINEYLGIPRSDQFRGIIPKGGTIMGYPDDDE